MSAPPPLTPQGEAVVGLLADRDPGVMPGARQLLATVARNAGAVPECYDRPPAPEGRWLQRVPPTPHTRAVWRWYPRWYADRCAAWDTAATTPPVPLAEGWRCRGCRWLPGAGAVALVAEDAHDRVMGPIFQSMHDWIAEMKPAEHRIGHATETFGPEQVAAHIADSVAPVARKAHVDLDADRARYAAMLAGMKQGVTRVVSLPSGAVLSEELLAEAFDKAVDAAYQFSTEEPAPDGYVIANERAAVFGHGDQRVLVMADGGLKLCHMANGSTLSFASSGEELVSMAGIAGVWVDDEIPNTTPPESRL